MMITDLEEIKKKALALGPGIWSHRLGKDDPINIIVTDPSMVEDPTLAELAKKALVVIMIAVKP